MKILIIIYFFLLSFSISSKEINFTSPVLKNYPSQETGGTRATWGIAQNKNGKMFFINTYGVLVFDGSNWRSMRLKGNSIPRAIHADEKGNILIGFNGELGTISFSKSGEYFYKKISEIAPSETPREIYKIQNSENYFIRTTKALFIYSQVEKKISLVNTPKGFKFGVASQIEGKIYVFVKGKGLYLFENNNLSIIKGTEILKNSKQTIFAVFKNNDDLILITSRSGILRLKKGALEKIPINNISFKNTKVYRAIILPNNKYALATYDGIFILNKQFQLIQHIAEDNGLLNNNVRSLFVDHDNNLWAGLNDGISKIKYNLDYRLLDRNKANINSITNNILEYNDKFYVSTPKGVMTSKEDKQNLRFTFYPIARDKLQTQTWKIVVHQGELYAGSNIGLGIINNEDKYVSILSRKQIGSIYKLYSSKIFNDTLVVGGGNGFHLVNTKNFSIKKFPEIDKGKVWEIYEDDKKKEIYLRILKKGIFKIKFNDINSYDDYSLEKYTYENGLPDNFYSINFLNLNNEVLYSTDKGIYKKDQENKFILDDRFFNLPSYQFKKVDSFINLSNGKSWLVFSENKNSQREVAIYEVDNFFKLTQLHVDKDLLRGFSRINMTERNDKVLLTGTNGVILFPNNFKSKKANGRTLLTQIKVNDVKVYNGSPHYDFLVNNLNIKNIFSYKENNLSFKITNTDYFNEKRNQFRYKLVNLMDSYSEYSSSREVAFTNLNPGEYKLLIEGKNSIEQKLLPYEYSFTIKPPWWETTYFYLGEIFFFLLLLLITAFSKKSTKAQKFATAMTFVVIIIVFELLNLIIDPLIVKLTGGIPVFDLVSKIILGLLLQPVEKLASILLDKFSDFVVPKKKDIKKA